MTIKKIIDSKIKTMTDLSGNKTKILYLKNEKEINEFNQQLFNYSVSNYREMLLDFLDWYNEDAEKTPITEDEIDLFIKEKFK